MEKIGLVAGAGSFPLLFAAEAKKAGREVFVVGLNDITPKEIEQYAVETRYFRLGNVGGPIDYLRDSGVKKVLMIGSIPHVNIFGGILPDMRAAKLLFKLRDKSSFIGNKFSINAVLKFRIFFLTRGKRKGKQ